MAQARSNSAAIGDGPREHQARPADRLARLRELAEGVVSGAGMELVELEFGGSGHNRVLRVFIDREGGITHSDCELISRQLSALLDAGAAVPGESSYVLEVSSPGLDRRLSKPEHFQRFAGQHIRVLLRDGLQRDSTKAPRRKLTGILEQLEGESIVLRPDPGQVPNAGGPSQTPSLRIRLDNIERANLIPQWD